MPAETTEKQKNLRDLLFYAEEILKIGERVISDLAKDAFVSFYEHDVAGLEGVTVNASEGWWVSVARLREISPPKPDPMFAEWVAKTTGTDPFEAPRLTDHRMLSVSVEEISDLVEAGLVTMEDVMRPRDAASGFPDHLDVILRTQNMPEFVAAFADYVDGPWKAWAEVEKPRRRSIAFYNRLFEAQQRMAAMGDDVAIESVFGIGMARWNHPQGRVNVPLLEAAVELELDPEHGAILIRPRPQPPRLCLRAFEKLEIEALGKLYREASAQLERSYEDPDIGFSPFGKFGFEPVLRMCHARLSASSIYEPDVREDPKDRTPPKADDTLRISDTWVLYIRQRSVDFRCDDIRKLVARVEQTKDENELPAPALQLTSTPADKKVDGDEVDLWDTTLPLPDQLTVSSPPASPSSGGGEDGSALDRAFFFPLPYNDEQMEIVRRLEQKDVSGVVVQGPPGTGKTHTIANIICHYMATGRRVLVSANKPEALSSIQGKLPEAIRDLAIAVIHSDRDGGRQLEQAVDILSSQVKQIDRRAYNERRIELERQLATVRKGIADIDDKILDYAQRNSAPFTYGGEKYLPMDLAGVIQAHRPDHKWFQDELDVNEAFAPRFNEADIEEARHIRFALKLDIVYRADQLPDAQSLPDVPHILSAHASLSRERQIEGRAAAGDLPFLSIGTPSALDEARLLSEWLNAYHQWLEDIRESEAWLMQLFQMLGGATVVDKSIKDGLHTLCEEWLELHEESKSFLLRGIELPDVVPGDVPFDAAVEALAEGKKAFGLFPFGKSALKAQIEGVRLAGRKPEVADGWSVIRDYRRWQKRANGFIGRWSAAAKAVGFPPLPDHHETGLAELARLGHLVDRMYDFQRVAAARIEALATLFPYGVDGQRVVFHGDLAIVREALQANLEKEGNAEAREIQRCLDTAVIDASLPFYAALDDFRDALGNPDIQARDLADGWREILVEARRLGDLRQMRRRLEEIAAKVRASGAPIWASKLTTESVTNGEDVWTPPSWRVTWEWARAFGFVRQISDRATLARLTEARTKLEDDQRNLLSEIVRTRTFIGLKQGITERVASALAKFAMKVRQLGAGTGKAAERHRRAIREATLEAAEAVPCWILPEWRVAEQLPSELAIFDLVIIDEASQSDITSLPTVVRGKKLLVVGDDKQVSPTAIGMEEKSVIQLRETYLRGMAVKNYLDPATSLYDLASITFPGSVIMLREHFRCVEPIIRFSSRFYPKALIPLRLPTASERLDPPLIDVFVPHGRKVRDVNEAEADFIVTEIKRLVADPTFAERTIGVISLIGDKQARRIQERLTVEIGTEAITRRRLTCGNAATFQGQERDIVFLSMVACRDTARAQTARMIEQRFNVAMSRARDRLYLVRSLTASMLDQRDLKAAVLEHFRDPMGGAIVAQAKDVLELCDSDFEREVGRHLLDRGYRLNPQVEVGGFRIDFVVEGNGDRRLAVELDGDRYHGPDKWTEDLYRQRALERLGWKFWRCWGSHWLTDPQGCLDDLLRTLTHLGIEPIGGDFSAQKWTEHRVVDMPQTATENGPTQQPNTPITSADEGTGPISAGVAHAPSEPRPDSRTTKHLESEGVVEIGDTVIFRFADDNRVRRIRLSADTNNPEDGVIHVNQPIAAALLGGAIDEEVKFTVGGEPRVAIIERITKGTDHLRAAN